MKKKAELPEMFVPSGTQHWRHWLEKNHQKKSSIWLVCYKKKANVPTVTWSEAVDEALCFGWIDSLRKPIDDEKFRQYFCKRKPTSAWSGINKKKVKGLIKAGLMTEAGLKCIEVSKKNGTWTMLDEVEKLTIPPDLNRALRISPEAKKYFTSRSRTDKRILLQWLVFAKRDETRQRRINEIVLWASKGMKPKPFQ